MKKLYVTLAFASLTSFAVAQSQRLILIEEFTQASCGPCAAANPAFNTLLNANTTKAISLKYQVSWPGVDPMNSQYPSVSLRANFYTVTGVPYALMDGVAATGSNYTGHPGNLTQSEINTQYNVPSPFTLDVQHVLSSDQDSIYITAHVTGSQNYSTNTGYLRLHTALIEKHIDFSSPPGSNGETDFYNVVRKMIPNTAGTGLANVWVPGQDTTFVLGAPIPSYIYDVNQLAVVCFIQDNLNKQIQQAGYSISPLSVQNVSDNNASMNLFPNPASSVARVAFSLPASSDLVINIYNSTGMLVRSEKRGTVSAGKQEAEINVENLADGIYMVQLMAGETKAVSRFSVVH